MKNYRNIKRLVKGVPAIDGAGVQLVRLVGNSDVKDFDPFLLFDAFDSTDPSTYIKGFPWHPHRGMETVTYLIEGEIEHGDSLGNTDVIRAGDCQWMTAGSGIIHQEMPRPANRLLGGQLWLNLPKKNKMASPQYKPIVKNEIPVIEEEHAIVRILTGAYKEHKGATDGDYVKASYLDITVHPESEWEIDTPPSHTVFIYIVEGKATFGHDYPRTISAKNVVLFETGEALKLHTTENPVRFLLMSGKPLQEPVAWGGPIVMNTREELMLAFQELDENTFIK
jgi:hypothetical protein